MTGDDFFEVMRVYNRALGPVPFVAYAAALFALFLFFFPTRRATSAVTVILAAMWFINGFVFEFLYHSQINDYARIYGVLFIAEGLLIVAAPYLFDRGLHFRLLYTTRGMVGMALIFGAVLLYPVWHVQAGGDFAALPILGTAPAPTTIFTIGALLCGTNKALRYLLPVPVVLAAASGATSIAAGILQDAITCVAALAGAWFLYAAFRSSAEEPGEQIAFTEDDE